LKNNKIKREPMYPMTCRFSQSETNKMVKLSTLFECKTAEIVRMLCRIKLTQYAGMTTKNIYQDLKKHHDYNAPTEEKG